MRSLAPEITLSRLFHLTLSGMSDNAWLFAISVVWLIIVAGAFGFVIFAPQAPEASSPPLPGYHV